MQIVSDSVVRTLFVEAEPSRMRNKYVFAIRAFKSHFSDEDITGGQFFFFLKHCQVVL